MITETIGPSAPPPPKPSGTGKLLGWVFLGNVVTIFWLVFIDEGKTALLLPIYNIVVGLGLLFTKYRPLGKVMLLSGLVVALIGLGICGYMITHMGGGH